MPWSDWRLWAAVVCAALLSACATQGPAYLQGAQGRPESWAPARGWTPMALPPGQFKLLALLRQTGQTPSLTVYLEGDGAPWPGAYRPPRDPTPLRPMALLLAERDPSSNVAYLGRPCQYLAPAALVDCSSVYWSERRFAPEVLSTMNLALNHLKQLTGAERLRLIGYSGGGVIATLLAQRRDDVDALVTLAAPLALAEWTRLKGLSPLHGSLDPLDGPGPLPYAVHLVGKRDQVVPDAIGARFVARHGGRLQRLPDFDHGCCWVEHWPRLLPNQETE